MKQPKVAKRSAAQIAAGAKFAAGGRAAQAKKRAAYAKSHHGAKLPRTDAQKQATLKNAAAGRAAQAARRKGKLPPKKAAAIAPVSLPPEVSLPGWSLGCNDVAPSCAAAAVANHMLASTGLTMTEGEIRMLHKLAGGDEGAMISDVLEALRANWKSFCQGRARLVSFTPTDEDVLVAGLVVGISLPHARHAVLSHPFGMVTWGQVMPWAGEPYEAWALEWAM